MKHSFPLRVYYEDTDASGIVYYANYLKFAERGRTEMIRVLGFAHSEVYRDTGIAFAVRHLSADYRGPARLDDWLIVETRVEAIGAATLSLDQRILRDGEVLVALNVLVACIGRDGRPRRLPPGLRAALLAPGPPAGMPPSQRRPGSRKPNRAGDNPPVVQKTP